MGTEAVDNSTCPKCGKRDIAKHSSWTHVTIGVVVFGGITLTGGLDPRSWGDSPFMALLGITGVFVLAGTVAAGFSAMAGNHKCKACGEQWR